MQLDSGHSRLDNAAYFVSVDDRPKLDRGVVRSLTWRTMKPRHLVGSHFRFGEFDSKNHFVELLRFGHVVNGNLELVDGIGM